jgi:ketosteroid isomerase-like protein
VKSGFIFNHQHLRPISASAMHRCMELTQESIKQIERIHSEWIQMEAAGENRRLLDLCADDIEFWPPDRPPILGRKAIVAQISIGSDQVESIEIADRSIRGSNDIAYLTASYKTKLSSAQNGSRRQIVGSHIWILKNHAGTWQVILVAWSRWL